MLAGTVLAGWQMARALLAAEGRADDFARAKVVTARFYGEHILNRAPALRDSIVDGADAITGMALEAF
jgi:hypothetical protein